MSLPLDILLRVAVEANILKLMGEQQTRSLTVDYVPPNAAMIMPRLDAPDEKLTPIAREPIEITYTLEDAMFGGSVWVALIVGSQVVVNPFLWKGWDDLKTSTINVTRR